MFDEQFVGESQPLAIANINCINCGDAIPYNPTTKCITCYGSEVDIFENIDKVIHFKSCRLCGRMHQYPSQWINMTFGTKEHLEFLLRHIRNLDSVNVVDAAFTAIIKDAKRFVVALKASKEIMESFTFQQACEVTFRNKNYTCPDCHKKETQEFWRAQVQIRQKVHNKRSFYYLEQILLKEKVMNDVLKIEKAVNGVDVFYSDRKYALKLLQFVQSKIPCSVSETAKLISEDVKNGNANIKYTFCVQIVPICRDSLVFLSEKIAEKHGNINRIAICTKVNANIHVIDPFTLKTAIISAKEYFQYPFQMLADHKSLQRFMVVDVDRHVERNSKQTNKSIKKLKHRQKSRANNKNSSLSDESSQLNTKSNNRNEFSDAAPVQSNNCEGIGKKLQMAEVSLLQHHTDGSYGSQFIQSLTHLGHLINPNDIVLVYDMSFSHDDQAREYYESKCHNNFSSLVVVRKFDLDKRREQRSNRAFKLRRLRTISQAVGDDARSGGEMTGASVSTANDDYEDFLEELEEDAEMRQNVDLFRDDAKIDKLKQHGRLEVLEKYTDIKIALSFLSKSLRPEMPPPSSNVCNSNSSTERCESSAARLSVGKLSDVKLLKRQISSLLLDEGHSLVTLEACGSQAITRLIQALLLLQYATASGEKCARLNIQYSSSSTSTSNVDERCAVMRPDAAEAVISGANRARCMRVKKISKLTATVNLL